MFARFCKYRVLNWKWNNLTARAKDKAWPVLLVVRSLQNSVEQAQEVEGDHHSEKHVKQILWDQKNRTIDSLEDYTLNMPGSIHTGPALRMSHCAYQVLPLEFIVKNTTGCFHFSQAKNSWSSALIKQLIYVAEALNIAVSTGVITDSYIHNYTLINNPLYHNYNYPKIHFTALQVKPRFIWGKKVVAKTGHIPKNNWHHRTSTYYSDMDFM